MKRFVVLVLLSISFTTSTYAAVNDDLGAGGTEYLDVYESGKTSGAKIIANIFIRNIDGKSEITWKHIYITPFPQQKDVVLKIEIFSTTDNTIQNFVVNNDSTYTFTIVPSPYVLDPKSVRNINVWVKMSEDGRIEDIRGQMAFWRNITNQTTEVLWKRAKESHFVLPYNRVF